MESNPKDWSVDEVEKFILTTDCAPVAKLLKEEVSVYFLDTLKFLRGLIQASYFLKHLQNHFHSKLHKTYRFILQDFEYFFSLTVMNFSKWIQSLFLTDFLNMIVVQ